MKKLLIFVFALCAGIAHATPIVFVHTGSGAGSLDGVSFENTTFTITSYADTDDRESFSAGYFIHHLSSMIEIDGIGVLNLVTATRTFVNNNSSLVGYSRSSGPDLFNGPVNAAFNVWDMLSSIGPIFGNASLLQWTLSDVVTDQGVLIFDSETSSASFQAITVPTPHTLFLFSAGLLILSLRKKCC